MMMQQGGLTGNSGDTPAGTSEAREPGGSGGSEAGGVFEEDKGRSEESERSSGGNRWPRQETIALLKIRSDMDVAFRDSSLKGPLWEEVSRKLAELGYHRNAKKCKEKFENVYKYHKRTKDGRTSKPDGKTYRFFEQLEALDTHPPTPSLSSSMRPQAPIPITTMAAPTMLGSTTHATTPIVTNVTVPSTPNPITTTHVFQNNVVPIMNPSYLSSQPPPRATVTISPSVPSISAIHANVGESPLSISTSSSTSSDEEPEKRRKRKRKWEDFFGTLMTQVIQKQDELQKKFLETLDKRESERVMREEAWRAQEMAKMNREHELLVQERSVAAAKDAAVIAFLQKVTEHQNPQNPIVLPQLPQIQANVQQNPPPPPSAVAPPPQSSQPPQQQVSVSAPVPAVAPPPAQAPPPVRSMDIQTGNNAGDNFLSPSPSRWPKAEVQALIQLRTTLDTKYHESGPKGPLWEEISTSMRKLGYNRNAKRCKEKWENINKYYKKVKESNKKRPEDAKTCPYFHQLEALYKEKGKNEGSSSLNPGLNIRPENPMVPIMAQPEQQWPQPQQQQPQEEENQQQDLVMEENENQKMGQNDDDDDYEDVDDDEEDDEDDGAGYEIVTNKQPSSATDRRE